MHRFRSIPGVLFLTGVALILGVIVINTVINIEHHDGNYKSYTSHSLRVDLGFVVIAGLLLIVFAILGSIANGRARRKVSLERQLSGESNG